MKIAIVGSGIAGLTAAYRLNQAGQHVTLFEKQHALGMDAHSIEIASGDQSLRADVPSRMFNELQWPNLLRLYQEIGLEFKPVSPTQSFGSLNGETYLNLDVAHQPWLAARALFNSSLRSIINQALDFQKQGAHDLEQGLAGNLTFANYLKEREINEGFIRGFLYPTLSSTVLTCSYSALDNYPAEIVLGCLKNLTDSPALLRSRFGTRDVVERLTKGIQDIRLDCNVLAVDRNKDQIDVRYSGGQERFDQLVVATQANHAIQFVGDHSIASTLGDIQYEDVEVVVHSDRTLMPKQQTHWSTFNMISLDDRSAAMCSVHLNQFHDEWRAGSDLFQTINPVCQADPASVKSVSKLQRPVVTKDSYSHWQAIADFNESNTGISLVGSYAHHGVPLLETGVQSSSLAVERILGIRASA